MIEPAIKTLFIDDEPGSINPIMGELTEEGYECTLVDFSDDIKEIENNIYRYNPDIIILDIFKGRPVEQNFLGETDYDRIWQTRFCPIIIYSAQPDDWDKDEHPFVKKVQKGSQSYSLIKEELEKFEPHIKVLREIEKNIKRELAIAIRDLAPNAFEIYSDPKDANKREEMILRCGRRRVAALMDCHSLDYQGDLISWEQYLFPPIRESYNLGDILFEKSKSKDEPSSFYIILTPSCDLDESPRRLPKVESILLAHCCSIKEGIKRTSLCTYPHSELPKRLPSLLSQGYFEKMIFLPALAGKIPHMMANLKNLELIKIAEIKEKYERIASIDSPFRELVAWAYLTVSCRPGLPVRDIKKWCDEIVENYINDVENSSKVKQ